MIYMEKKDQGKQHLVNQLSSQLATCIISYTASHSRWKSFMVLVDRSVANHKPFLVKQPVQQALTIQDYQPLMFFSNIQFSFANFSTFKLNNQQYSYIYIYIYIYIAIIIQLATFPCMLSKRDLQRRLGLLKQGVTIFTIT